MKARRTVDKKFQERIRNEVAEEMLKQTNDITSRVFKLFCVTLNKDFGFGQKRLVRLIRKIEEISKERDQDEVFWAHIDKYAIEYLGLEFKREDYDRMDR